MAWAQTLPSILLKPPLPYPNPGIEEGNLVLEELSGTSRSLLVNLGEMTTSEQPSSCCPFQPHCCLKGCTNWHSLNSHVFPFSYSRVSFYLSSSSHKNWRYLTSLRLCKLEWQSGFKTFQRETDHRCLISLGNETKNKRGKIPFSRAPWPKVCSLQTTAFGKAHLAKCLMSFSKYIADYWWWNSGRNRSRSFIPHCPVLSYYSAVFGG